MSRANPFAGDWPFRDGIPDLSQPPIDFGPQPSLWLKIPQFREIEQANWFEYEVGDQ
jgi:hypothetical protein